VCGVVSCRLKFGQCGMKWLACQSVGGHHPPKKKHHPYTHTAHTAYLMSSSCTPTSSVERRLETLSSSSLRGSFDRSVMAASVGGGAACLLRLWVSCHG
jgi:hypothetical protein